MSDKITVFKANFQDFLKWCEKQDMATNSVEEIKRAIDGYVIEVLRIRTKYVN